MCADGIYYLPGGGGGHRAVDPRAGALRKSRGGPYPENWQEIAQATKDAAGWHCVRCGISHQSGHVLTVHHLDMNPANNAWWNLAALCQQCHLHIQARVVMERIWIFDHSEWFKPFVAGYYAHLQGLPEDRIYVMENLDKLLDFGKGKQNENPRNP